MRPAIGILLLLAVGLAIGASVHFAGLRSVVDDATSLAALIDRAGPSAPIAFVVVFALLNAFGFPGLLLVGALARLRRAPRRSTAAHGDTDPAGVLPQPTVALVSRSVTGVLHRAAAR